MSHQQRKHACATAASTTVEDEYSPLGERLHAWTMPAQPDNPSRDPPTVIAAAYPVVHNNNNNHLSVSNHFCHQLAPPRNCFADQAPVTTDASNDDFWTLLDLYLQEESRSAGNPPSHAAGMLGPVLPNSTTSYTEEQSNVFPTGYPFSNVNDEDTLLQEISAMAAAASYKAPAANSSDDSSTYCGVTTMASAEVVPLSARAGSFNGQWFQQQQSSCSSYTSLWPSVGTQSKMWEYRESVSTSVGAATATSCDTSTSSPDVNAAARGPASRSSSGDGLVLDTSASGVHTAGLSMNDPRSSAAALDSVVASASEHQDRLLTLESSQMHLHQAAMGGGATTSIQKLQCFKTKSCRYWLEGRCTRGSRCTYAHGDEELRARPDLTKTKVCGKWKLGQCPLTAEQCAYAHGIEDLRSVVIPSQVAEAATEPEVHTSALSASSSVSSFILEQMGHHHHHLSGQPLGQEPKSNSYIFQRLLNAGLPQSLPRFHVQLVQSPCADKMTDGKDMTVSYQDSPGLGPKQGSPFKAYEWSSPKDELSSLANELLIL